MLPLIGALAGSALAPSLGLSALTAGAIGSGLGTFAQTGDLEKGVLAGLGSYGIGALGSKLMGGAEAAGQAAGQTAQTPTAIKEGMKAGTGVTMAQPPMVQPPYKPPVQPPVLDRIEAPFTTTNPITKPDVGFFDRPMPKIPTGPGRSGLPQLGSADPDTIGTTIATGLSTGIAGESLAYEPPEFKKKEYKDIPEAEAKQYNVTLPGQGYRAGYDPEFSYFAKEGGIMRLQEGGQVAGDFSMKNDKEVLDGAIRAVKGQDPQPEMVLGEFLRRFGEEALRSLVRSVRAGEVDMAAGRAEGMINGAGDGMEDLVPASLDGQQDVMLSEGEFVVPADVVSGIGNGSTDAGAERLYEMLDRVRETRTGRQQQAPQINATQMMPA
jgi:hypothetical protein